MNFTRKVKKMQISKRQYSKPSDYSTYGKYNTKRDYITEYKFELDHNITEQTLEQILKENGINISFGRIQKFVSKIENFDIETMTKSFKYIFTVRQFILM